MTDADILAYWNEGIEAHEEFRRSLTFIATEVPPGKPQIARSELNGQWVPRGDILCCVLHGRPDADDETFVIIDDQELTPMQFAEMPQHP